MPSEHTFKEKIIPITDFEIIENFIKPHHISDDTISNQTTFALSILVHILFINELLKNNRTGYLYLQLVTIKEV